ncbi:MAG: TlpA family protein disulfide reductase, partial [Planctomycetes bacterium]|nr:TlpA family protein disulfide reductase [Planctomycetota bacterium]
KTAPPKPPIEPSFARPATRPQLKLGEPTSAGAKLRLYTTMATWCAACKRELAQVERLRSAFASDSLAMFGVPVDPDDAVEKLNGFLAQYRPAYELLTDLTAEQKSSVEQVVKDALKGEGLPATILTDGGGRVLRTMWGVPSVSEVRQLLGEAGGTQL